MEPGKNITNTDRQLPELTPKENAICRALTVFNQLRAFKLDLFEVLQWKDTIVRVKPDVDVEALKLAIDGLVSGEIPYDQSIGIKNIFIALRRITRDENGKLITLKPVY
jgi:hypothetical protein